MGTFVTTERSIRSSPLRNARITGILWLMCIVTGVFSFVITMPIIVANDAAATAANVIAKESLFRLASLANILSGGCYLGVTALLYYLLKPVSRSLSLTAAFFGAAGVAMGAVAYLANFASVYLLRGDPYLSAFTTNQVQALAFFGLKLQVEVFNIGMIFFGVQCFVAGYLIARSAFLPHLIGVILAIGGSSYVISSFVSLLAPRLGAHLVPFIMPVALVGEGSLTVWLLVRGVNAQRWMEQASAA